MLCKKIENQNKKNPLTTSVGCKEKLSLVEKKTTKPSTAKYTITNSNCNLNFWGAGPMDQDLKFY
ncbi:hypothetical protein [Clostridium formicaceticum]|uniref:Uncharacterized protein n=1 Tax=Clostridium formicaceticum TaxID=1497 RepID=A0AAC9RRI5_9CLOT|nr:hypothetical protein [Clostridium formicaceticum]AOY75240.1 hypothetical protein BJL90_04560 [Clostridium formicaceticum]ARE89673.1 hypothetical protein CLFO_41540 [Clostridium formicaceticum]